MVSSFIGSVERQSAATGCQRAHSDFKIEIELFMNTSPRRGEAVDQPRLVRCWICFSVDLTIIGFTLPSKLANGCDDRSSIESVHYGSRVLHGLRLTLLPPRPNSDYWLLKALSLVDLELNPLAVRSVHSAED